MGIEGNVGEIIRGNYGKVFSDREHNHLLICGVTVKQQVANCRTVPFGIG